MRLTARERQYLKLIAKYPGETNRSIARRMGVKHGTVQRHATHAYLKIGANGKCDACVKVVTGEIKIDDD